MFLLALEAGNPEEEMQLVKEKEEIAQDTLRKIDKKNLWSYGENKLHLATVGLHSQTPQRKCLENYFS